jgi:uncharacterized membrane protein YphA (DoxX/SURF4 family)
MSRELNSRSGRLTGVIRPWLALAARLVLAVVFAVAGWSKVADVAGSGRAVNAYRLMPFEVAKVVGAALPFVELALALLLLVGLATRLAAGIAAGLLTVFLAGIASVWARGLSIDCGCFGGGGQLAPGTHPSYLWDILRDVALLGLAVFLVLTPRTPVSADNYVLGSEVVP